MKETTFEVISLKLIMCNILMTLGNSPSMIEMKFNKTK